MLRFFSCLTLSLSFLAVDDLRAADAVSKVEFERDIRPIFETYCVRCHGDKRRKGGVLLTSRADALLPGDSGKRPVVPGSSAASELISRITASDAEQRMPPAGEPLDAAQIDLLRKWIDQGAVWADATAKNKHWAYIRPQRPTPPHAKNSDWTINPIDQFILARLEKEAIAPAPLAERERLLRRLYLDLIGLPPTLAEVDAFVSDSRPDAYPRVVDQLLASPHYGEHWARSWLDLARYADSNGYQRDGFRTVWPYRDWVVNAFNRDMPFDCFTIEQVAGDLLSSATAEQRVATGFSRCTTVNVEAGTDQEEDRVNAVFDRVNTLATVWLGTSMTCAQCHNHKYDPFTQQDYYRLFACFNSTELETEGGKSAVRQFVGPKMSLAESAEQKAQRQELAEQRDSLKKFVDVRTSLWAAVNQPEAEEQVRKDPKEMKKLTADLRESLAVADEARTDEQKEELTTYLSNRDAEIAKLRKELAALDEKIKSIEPPSTLVMAEMPTPRDSFVFKRGDFLKHGVRVQPGVPDVLHPLPADAPANRLGLAQWLVAAENPLVGRVTVNRWWAAFFGRGIVESGEDFGSQCTPPTHPELLDWLACEFQDNGWSMKRIHRLIVTSATYRQASSPVSPRGRGIGGEGLKDPYNRLYARGPRLRMDAETVRDNALAVSGLLSPKIGGVPVMPPQPEGIWNVTGAVDNTYRPSQGEDRFRRGLYTIWRRSSPYPSFVAFDAPDRAACVVNRTRTNTPLQALTLMNDPVYVEAALGLGRRMLNSEGSDIDRIVYGFRLCMSRQPKAEERELLMQLYEKAFVRYRDDPAAAQDVIRYWSGPKDADAVAWAAWFQVATVLLNLDEAIIKG